MKILGGEFKILFTKLLARGSRMCKFQLVIFPIFCVLKAFLLSGFLKKSVGACFLPLSSPFVHLWFQVILLPVNCTLATRPCSRFVCTTINFFSSTIIFVFFNDYFLFSFLQQLLFHQCFHNYKNTNG